MFENAWVYSKGFKTTDRGRRQTAHRTDSNGLSLCTKQKIKGGPHFYTHDDWLILPDLFPDACEKCSDIVLERWDKWFESDGDMRYDRNF